MGSAQMIKGITRENLQAVLKDTAVQMVRHLWSYPNRGVPHISFSDSIFINTISTYCDSVCCTQTYILGNPRPHSPNTKVCCLPNLQYGNLIAPDHLGVDAAS